MADEQINGSTDRAQLDGGMLDVGDVPAPSTGASAGKSENEHVELDALDLEALDDDFEDEETGGDEDEEESYEAGPRLGLKDILRDHLPSLPSAREMRKIAAILLIALLAGMGLPAAKDGLVALFTTPPVPPKSDPINLEPPPETPTPDEELRRALTPIFWKAVEAIDRKTTVISAHYVSATRKQPESVLASAVKGDKDEALHAAPRPPSRRVAQGPACPDCLLDSDTLHPNRLF